MRLKQYLVFVEGLLSSRRDLTVEELEIREIEPDRTARLRGRAQFWDGSTLQFAESLAMRGLALAKTRYSYHYQDAGEHLVFRYDNVPHHPQVATYPHHKHIGSASLVERVEAAQAPELLAVLREIETHLYPSNK